MLLIHLQKMRYDILS